MHYKKPFFSMDSEEVKVQLAPFTVSAIQKRKRPCRLQDRVLNLSSLFFFCFSPSQAVIIAVTSNKMQKSLFLKDKI